MVKPDRKTIDRLDVELMLSLTNLKKIAGRERVPQGTIEKDFVLSVALQLIAQMPIESQLIFKGGTAIKKIYYSDARFSEDLDFTVQKLSKEQTIKEFERTFNTQIIEGIEFGKMKKEETSEGLKATLKYRGPLAYSNSIRFDFSFRDNVFQKPLQQILLDTYQLGEHSITVLSIEELFAEKIHALGSRTAPRDLFDVWYLLKKGHHPNPELAHKKFAYYHEKLNLQKIGKNMEIMKTDWKQDLAAFISPLPEYATIEKEVKAELSKLA